MFVMPRFRPTRWIGLLLLTGLSLQAQAQLGQNAPSQSKRNERGVVRETPPPTVDPEMTKFQQLQDQTVYKKGFDKRRFFFGGDLGAQFGSLTAIDIAPTVGYTFHRMFKMGISLSFEYFAYNHYTPISIERRRHFIYGGSVFARFYPIKYVYLHVEMMGLNQPRPGSDKRRWMGYPLVGLGYNQPVGERTALQLQLLWNLNNSSESILANPIVSLGFNMRP